jgi:formylglycine-generating enzyme required for sulfatase activity
VLRGGCYYDDAGGLQVGYRNDVGPRGADGGMGFRFARTN